jgi:hypothetical protein
MEERKKGAKDSKEKREHRHNMDHFAVFPPVEERKRDWKMSVLMSG